MADQLTGEIIGAAIEVHRELGPGLLESIYETALCRELDIRKLPFLRQIPVEVIYKGKVIRGQRIDLVVQERVVVEVKSLQVLPSVALAQILSYLRASKLKKGLIINFGVLRLVDGVKRVSL